MDVRLISGAIILLLSLFFFFFFVTTISASPEIRPAGLRGRSLDYGWGPRPGRVCCPCSPPEVPPPPRPQRVIVVGGKDKWRFGINYMDWVKKERPFYENDILEFDYPFPGVKGQKKSLNHSVHLFLDYESFDSCNMSGSVRVGNEYDGGAHGGFKFQLGTKSAEYEQFYYFACGEGNGYHCNEGKMKFFVKLTD